MLRYLNQIKVWSTRQRGELVNALALCSPSHEICRVNEVMALTSF